MTSSHLPRILIDLTVAPAGGAGTYVAGFARGLESCDPSMRSQIIVAVSSSWASDNAQLVQSLKRSGIHLERLEISAPGSWSARLGRGRLLRRLCQKHGADIAFIPRDVAPRLRVPSVVLVRNRYAWSEFSSSAAVGGRLSALLLRHAARRSACRAVAVLSVSAYMASFLPPDIGTRAIVVHHGCDLPTRDSPVALNEPPRALMVGNLLRQKGIELAIEAVSIARSDGAHWDLEIYGNASDPVYRRELDGIADSLLHESPFRGPAFGTKLVEAYHTADVVIVGGTFESFCFPLIEAMRSGCVVVAPESPLVAEICAGTAITYETNDSASLAAALKLAASQRVERAQRGIEESTRFTWDRSARATIDAIVAAWARTFGDGVS